MDTWLICVIVGGVIVFCLVVALAIKRLLEARRVSQCEAILRDTSQHPKDVHMSDALLKVGVVSGGLLGLNR
jgi:hypothetical protein